MALYHLQAKIISRGKGQSVVAAAAYRAAAKLKNQWDGITHDYTAKQYVAHTEVILPAHAPEEWKNIETLWNEVELSEKSINAVLGREFEISLPQELKLSENIRLAREFGQYLADQGMCVQVSVHNKPDNIHAHLLVTTKPVSQKGTFEKKKAKAYLCTDRKTEKAFTAEELKKNQGTWKKQYRYQNGKKKIWLTKEEGEQLGLRRVNRDPKSISVENSVIARWNQKETLFDWRETWEVLCNEALRRNGFEERIDCRSYEEQGIKKIPYISQTRQEVILRKKGIETETARMNRKIEEDNKHLKELEIRDRLERKRLSQKISELKKEKQDVEETLEGLAAQREQTAHERYMTKQALDETKRELDLILDTIDALEKAIRKHGFFRQKSTAESELKKNMLKVQEIRKKKSELEKRLYQTEDALAKMSDQLGKSREKVDMLNKELLKMRQDESEPKNAKTIKLSRNVTQTLRFLRNY